VPRVRLEHVHRPSAALARHLAIATGRGSGAFMQRLATAVTDDNREARLRGVDRLGRPLAPLRSARKGKYRGATGPPLAPFGASSQVVTRFKVATSITSNGGRLRAGWDGPPYLGYHFVGAGHNPVRDLAGITPAGWRGKVIPIVREFVRGGP
jgi:hypothetical protein